MLLLWSTASHLEMQRALRWWFKRQSARLISESEQIHNGLLQEVFAIRRGLELSLVDETGASAIQNRDWLTKTEKLHESLAQLSDVLFPPYLGESLPLAIQSLIQSLIQSQVIHPSITLKMLLPTEWHEMSPERDRIILNILHELLTLSLPAVAIADSHSVQLSSDGKRGELTISLTCGDRPALTALIHSKELAYLRRCFQCLTPGQCLCRVEALNITWRFRWNLHYPLK